jgi:hypothetical protein
MNRKPQEELSSVEHDVFATIQQLRAARFNVRGSDEAEEPAAIVRDILREYHGNVKLRLEVISEAWGRTMRTLEREFVAR